MAEMVVADSAQKGQNWRRPKQIFKWRAVNTMCTKEVLVLQEWQSD